MILWGQIINQIALQNGQLYIVRYRFVLNVENEVMNHIIQLLYVFPSGPSGCVNQTDLCGQDLPWTQELCNLHSHLGWPGKHHRQTGAGKCADSKVHGANMGPICGRQDPGGPHVSPMNFVIWVKNFGGIMTLQLIVVWWHLILSHFLKHYWIIVNETWRHLYRDSYSGSAQCIAKMCLKITKWKWQAQIPRWFKK